jgi:SWIRM domain
MENIHSLEKTALPEYFGNKISKTPEIYKRYRNYIIQLYRSNP